MLPADREDRRIVNGAGIFCRADRFDSPVQMINGCQRGVLDAILK